MYENVRTALPTQESVVKSPRATTAQTRHHNRRNKIVEPKRAQMTTAPYPLPYSDLAGLGGMAGSTAQDLVIEIMNPSTKLPFQEMMIKYGDHPAQHKVNQDRT